MSSVDDTSLYDFLSYFIYEPVPTHYSYAAVLAYQRKPEPHWSDIEERWAKLVRAVDELVIPEHPLPLWEDIALHKLRNKLFKEREDLYLSGYGLVFARERSLEYIKKMGVSEEDFEAYLGERPSTWVAVSTAVQEIKLRMQTGSTMQLAGATPSLSSIVAPSSASSSAPPSSLASAAMPMPATPSFSTEPTTSYRHHTLLIHWPPFIVTWEVPPHCLGGRPESGEERQLCGNWEGVAGAHDRDKLKRD
ncbi:hypothetical protein JCM10213_004263 [Rhodosporidiobolus nylandii]